MPNDCLQKFLKRMGAIMKGYLDEPVLKEDLSLIAQKYFPQIETHIRNSMLEAFDDVSDIGRKVFETPELVDQMPVLVRDRLVNAINSRRVMLREAQHFTKLMERAKDSKGLGIVIRDYYDQIRASRERAQELMDNLIKDQFEGAYGRGKKEIVPWKARNLFEDHVQGGTALIEELTNTFGADKLNRAIFDALKNSHTDGSPILDSIVTMYQGLEKAIQDITTREGIPYRPRKGYVFRMAPFRDAVMAKKEEYTRLLVEGLNFEVMLNKRNMTNEEKLAWVKQRIEHDITPEELRTTGSNRIDMSREFVFKSDDYEFEFFNNFMNPDLDILTSAFSHKTDLMNKIVSYRHTGANPTKHMSMIMDLAKARNETFSDPSGFFEVSRYFDAGKFRDVADLETAVKRFARVAGVGEHSDSDTMTGIRTFIDVTRSIMAVGLTPWSQPRGHILDESLMPRLHRWLYNRKGSILVNWLSEMGGSIPGVLDGAAIQKRTVAAKRVSVPIQVSAQAQIRGEAGQARVLKRNQSEAVRKTQMYTDFGFTVSGANRTIEYFRGKRVAEAGMMFNDMLTKKWEDLGNLDRSWLEDLDIQKADFEDFKKAVKMSYDGEEIFLDNIVSNNRRSNINESQAQANARLNVAYEGIIHHITDYLSTTRRNRSMLMSYDDTSDTGKVITQFWGMPLSQIRGIGDNLERAYGVGKGRGSIFIALKRAAVGNPVALAEAVGSVYMAGMMIGWLKDISEGRSPRDINDPMAMYQAIGESGIFGAAGSIASNIVYRDDPVGSTVATLLRELKRLSGGIVDADGQRIGRAAKNLTKMTAGVNHWAFGWAREKTFRDVFGVENAPITRSRNEERGRAPIENPGDLFDVWK